MAACLAEAAATATHTRMAVEVAELLSEAIPPDEALMTYIRGFDLPVKEGDTVFRAALAELADRRLPASQRPQLRVAASLEPVREVAGPVTAALPGAAFGLRVMVLARSCPQRHVGAARRCILTGGRHRLLSGAAR